MSDQTENKELQILFPTAELTIAGEKIEVKRIHAKTTITVQRHLCRLLRPYVLRLAIAKGDFNLDALMACLSDNYQDVIEACCIIYQQADQLYCQPQRA